MFSPAPSRARSSQVGFALESPAVAKAAPSVPRATRLPTRANTTAAAFLPKHALASAFAGATIGVGGTGVESSLSLVYGERGVGSSSSIVVRSLLTPTQIAQQQTARQLAVDDDDQEEDEQDIYIGSYVDPAPIRARLALRDSGDVHAIQCLSDRLLVAATSSGECTLVELSQGDANSAAGSSSFFRSRPSSSSGVNSSGLSLRAVHSFGVSPGGVVSGLAASLASSTPLVASCSEDGSFALMAPLTRTLVRRVDRAHPGALGAVAFSSSNTLHTAGTGGQIAAWDVRALTGSVGASTAPTRPSSLLCDPNAVSITSLAMHPTRAFNLAAGASNGCVSVFDLRAMSRPLCSIQAQSASVTGLVFLPWSPGTLAAASEDGSLCAFDFAAAAASSADSPDPADVIGVARDLTFSHDDATNRMRPSKLYQHTSGLNGLDVDRDSRTFLAPADGQAVVVAKQE